MTDRRQTQADSVRFFVPGKDRRLLENQLWHPRGARNALVR
jgi:hypothetical protein